MKTKEKVDLRELLIDAHAHFFFLKGEGATRVRLWQILPAGVVIDAPRGAPMRKTVLGYIPTLDGAGVYEVEGAINPEPITEQVPGSIRIDIDPSRVRRVNRRLYPRYSFTPPVDGSATPEGDKKAVPIKIVNFSAGGLRIESERELTAGKRHTFRFKVELDDEVHDLKLAGNIIYEIPMEGGKSYGVKFLEPGKNEKGEASVEALDQTVDLLAFVNRLLVRGS